MQLIEIVTGIWDDNVDRLHYSDIYKPRCMIWWQIIAEMFGNPSVSVTYTQWRDIW